DRVGVFLAGIGVFLGPVFDIRRGFLGLVVLRHDQPPGVLVIGVGLRIGSLIDMRRFLVGEQLAPRGAAAAIPGHGIGVLQVGVGQAGDAGGAEDAVVFVLNDRQLIRGPRSVDLRVPAC